MQDLETQIWDSRQTLYRFAYMYVHNEQDALDIVSQSIVKALKTQPKFQDESKAAAWIYRVVINTARDHLRKSKHIVSDLPEETCTDDPDATQRLDLEKVIFKLPEKYRTIVVLHYFEDMKLKDIAKIRNENLNTVKSRLRKALNIMKADISENIGNEI